MSRIADAYRRARSVTPAQPGIEPLIDLAKTWSLNELPWDLTEPGDANADPLATFPARQVSSGHRRSPVVAGSDVSEQLVPLVDRISHTPSPEARAQSLLFLTIDPDPDADPVCATTADVLAARTSKTVCVVDANLRSPALHRYFGLVSARGLSDALLAGGDVRLCTTRMTDNLWVMPAGSRGLDALPRLASEQCSAQLTQLVSLFDHVLLDIGGVSLHHEAIALAGSVDGVVLVINANATRREVARRTTESLQAVNATIVGAVLTNRSFPIPEGIYRRL